MRSILSLCVFVSLTLLARAVEPFEIREGDRVLFLGDTLLEREGTYGYLETRMHEQFPDRHFIVRNLSWSGETPRGWSRASFDNPDKGTERLKEDIAKVRPTVVFLGFGMAASLQEMTDRSADITLNPDPKRYGEEPMTAARFKTELGELMDAISGRVGVPPAGSGVPPERSSGNVKTSPQVREGGTPSPAGGTPTLPETPIRFVLLSPIRHEDLRAVKPGLPDPAEHNKLLEQYWKVIEELAKERGAGWVNPGTSALQDFGIVNVEKKEPLTENGIHLSRKGHEALSAVVSDQLGWRLPMVPERDSRGQIGKGTMKKLEQEEDRRQALRAAVIRKNELFFHQFRPANSTYLFGFRKHEQGQNAKEMPMFDPLIEAAEAEIDRLKKGAQAAAGSAPGSTGVPPVVAGVSPGTPGVAGAPAPAAQAVAGTGSPQAGVSPAATPKTAGGTPALPISGTPVPLPDFTVEDGYQIELWAQNPYLEKPTQMNWDAQGRLWVCSSSLYPMVEPGQAVDDKILILEDPDHTGKATKSTVFAAGLLIPTGVVPDLIPGRVGVPPAGSGVSPERSSGLGKSPQSSQVREGGTPSPAGGTPTLPETAAPGTPALSPSACYVGQSTELLYLRDTDGDGKADEKRIVFSGFGTEDTHHIVHTLHWGPDGRLYFHQSVYIHTHLETPWGMVRLNSGGVFAYDPRTERVEVFIKGLWNTWGQAEDEWGQSFFTDGAGSSGISWGFPGAIFAPFEGSRRQMTSISPGSYPKFAGLEIVKSPHFPAEWQGNAVTCDFRAHRIVRFAITDLAVEGGEHSTVGEKGERSTSNVQRSTSNEPTAAPSAPAAGPTSTLNVERWKLNVLPSARSGYTTTEQPDLVRTTDLSFRPIDVRLGPDGALYVADWSNPVINHGEVDFRDPRRDHHMGRIWRITKKGEPALKWEPLLGKKNEELLDKLLSKSAWEQQQARRVLIAEWSKSTGIIGIMRSIQARAGSITDPRESAAMLSLEAVRALPFSGEAPQTTLDSLVDERGTHKGIALSAVSAKAVAAGGDAGAISLLTRHQGMSVGTSAAYKAMAGNAAIQDGEMIGEKIATALRDSLAAAAGSNFPRVRLEAMRALARIPSASSASLVLDAALKTPENDPHYDFAAWLSINDLAKPWTDAIASGAWKTEGKEAQLAYGLKSIDPTLASATLSRLFAAGKVPVDGSGPWIELIGDAGGPAELQRLLDGLLAGYVGDCCETDATRAIDNKLALTGPVAPRAVAALLTAARVRNAKPAAHTDLVTALFHSQGEIGTGAIALAGLWHAPDAVAKIGELLDSRETKPPLRRAAVDGLRAAGGPAALGFLRVLTRAEETADTRSAALVAAVQVKLDAGLVLAAEVLPTFTDESVLLGTWRGLLGVKGAPDAFALKFGGGTRSVASPSNGSVPPTSQGLDGARPSIFASLPAPVIAAAVRAAREAGRPGAKLLAALAPFAGASANAVVSTDYTGLAAQTVQNGDPAKGELIYRRATSACTTCHAIGGAGGKVGPDMTSIGASAPLDYLIESILSPNAKVKEGYNAVSLTLADGTTATGIQARETASEVILRDAAGKESGVPKAMIKAKTDIGSMMPAGLTATMKPREAIDLYAFLSQLGKPGPYDASKGQVARVWALAGESERERIRRGEWVGDQAPNVFTLVDGRLLKEQLAEALPVLGNPGRSFFAVARFEGGGRIQLGLVGSLRPAIDGPAKVWVDGHPLLPPTDQTLELNQGVHVLAVELDPARLPEVLRANSADARFLGN